MYETNCKFFFSRPISGGFLRLGYIHCSLEDLFYFEGGHLRLVMHSGKCGNQYQYNFIAFIHLLQKNISPDKMTSSGFE